MLKEFKASGFKSLRNVHVRFQKLTVLFGPNAAGKSNILDALLALSRIGTASMVSEALSDPIRGLPIEAFAFSSGGLASLLSLHEARFELGADVGIGQEAFRYKVEIAINPQSGKIFVTHEYLAALEPSGVPSGNPLIEGDDSIRKARSKSQRLDVGGRDALGRTLLSDPAFSSKQYREIELCRSELSGWRVYYLDPRVAMRSAKSPSSVADVGVLGEDIAPFLYRLRAEQRKAYDAIRRTLSSVIPSVESVDVDLDKRRGTLDIIIRQNGTDFSSRIISEGTLRVLALCAIAVNPWSGSLIAFEEPENGVHPRRIELIAKMLLSIALQHKRQVVVTSHSPLFCNAVLREARSMPRDVALLNVRQGPEGTEVRQFDLTSPLFQDEEIRKALTSTSEDSLFESLMMRGMLDG